MSNLPCLPHDLPESSDLEYSINDDIEEMTQDEIDDYLEEKRYRERQRIRKNIDQDFPGKKRNEHVHPIFRNFLNAI